MGALGRLTLVISPSATPPIKNLITWRFLDKCSTMGLNLPLDNEDILILTRLSMEYGFSVKGEVRDVASFVSMCEGAICGFLRRLNYEPPGLAKGNGCFRLSIPPLEPLSTVLGFLLALPSFKLLGRKVVYELYSDSWQRLKDLLLYLKARGLNVNVYTSIDVKDKVPPFDRVVKRGSIIEPIKADLTSGGVGIRSYLDIIRSIAGDLNEVPLRAIVDLGIPMDVVNRLIAYGLASLGVSDDTIVLRINATSP